jgi:hypothetical protein
MSGIAELTFTISEEGTVSEAEVTLPSPGLSPRVVGCIRLALRRWSFPSAEGGVAHAHAAVTLTSGLTGANEPIAYANEFVVTRLHYRYERGGLGEDLVFRTAPPVAGGREVRNDAGALEETAPGYVNNFQARYAIRHAWQGAITCEHPVRGRWGGRPLGADPNAPFTGAAPTIAPAHAAPRVGAARSTLAIEPLVLTPVVDLGLSGRATASPPSTSATPAAGTAAAGTGASSTPGSSAPGSGTPGSGTPGSSAPASPALCAAHPGRSTPWLAALAALALGLVRTRRTRRA